ncbi:MAG: CotH kinase family protein [Paludibacteraceae bacterium]|nr:CotH kinase family protein [Paludibacteraceae bacterium]
MITKYTKSFLTLLLLCGSIAGNAAVQMNEIMPCNLSTYLNTDNYNFSGFIEFTNDQSQSVNLRGYTLIHYKKGSKKYSEKWTWQIQNDCMVNANSYTLMWFDESDRANHSPYKLDADGGYLLLKNGNTLVDSIAYGAQTAHISYGRYGNSTGYMEPTPGAANTTAYAELTRCQTPEFSEKGGLKHGNVNLQLSCVTAGATIRYTTDGSEPTQQSNIYNSSININSNTSVRAKAFANGMLPSAIATHSYIYADNDHNGCGGVTIPVVSLTVEDRYFNDNTVGMYVTGSNGSTGDKTCTMMRANYNNDWSRPVNFEYFVNGQQVLSQELEAAIEGGCSRTYTVKSLSLKASKKTGKNLVNYHFFGTKPDLYTQTIYLRNGGQGADAGMMWGGGFDFGGGMFGPGQGGQPGGQQNGQKNDKVKFRDALMQAYCTNMNIDYQAYQPVAYYLNGQYLGLMALMERTNASYVKANYGVDEEDLDLITLSDQKGIGVSKGTIDAYNELISYVESTDNTTPEFYAGACKRMDMDEYLEYQVFQQFICNADWPGNNTKIWRERKDGSRFRWIVFDTDYGCGHDGALNSASDMITYCRGEGKTNWGNQQTWMTTLFKHLSNNPEFAKQFTTKYLYHLSTTFTENRIRAVYDSITSLVEAEYCADMNKSAKEAANTMLTFLLERSANILQHLQTYAGTGAAVDFELRSNVAGAHFTMNGESVTGFKGKYLAEFATDFKAYPPAGYTFDHWEIQGQFNETEKKESCSTNLPGELSGSLTSTCTITAVFTPNSYDYTLAINELCASSDQNSGNVDAYGNYPDWIEVYNYGNEPIDLAGLYFSNKEENLQLSQIAYGSKSTVVESKQRVLVWANSDDVDGPLYLNFNLNVDKSKTVYLSTASDEIISLGSYDPHKTNESYGFKTDNSGDWVLFDVCDNKITATPDKVNGSITCNGVGLTDTENAASLSMYPNPTSDGVTINSKTLISNVSVLDVNGRTIMEYTPKQNEISINLNAIGQGVYVVRIECEDGVYNEKLIKQ